jgi:hypothetical protein
MLRHGPGGKGGGRSMVGGREPGQGQSRGNNCGPRRGGGAVNATVLMIAPGALSARRRPAGPRRDDGGSGWAFDANRARRPGLALFLLLGFLGFLRLGRPSAPGPSLGPSARTRVVPGAKSTVHVRPCSVLYEYLTTSLRHSYLDDQAKHTNIKLILSTPQ